MPGPDGAPVTPPRVTALRRGGRATIEVWLDGRPWRRLHEDVVVGAGLVVGAELDRVRARAVARERRRAAALGIAVRALRARDHSAASLRARLGERGVGDATGDEAVERLERAGIVDDRRTAGVRATSLAGRGLGNAAILADLEARGIPDGVAQEAVGALEPETTRAAAVVARHGRTLATARLLARRGFEEDLVHDLIASLDESAIA